MPPVIASKQSSATFADKEQIWADNASSSPFFGNVYVCFASFTGERPPMRVSRSTDGGDTWSTKQVSPAHNVAPSISASPDARSGRTATAAPTCSGRSSNVGAPADDRNALHGEVDGRRRELDAAAGDSQGDRPVLLRRSCHRPLRRGRSRRSAERPRGGPERGHRQRCSDGADATNLISRVGRRPRRPEQRACDVRASTNGTWSAPAAIETAGDRGYYAAPALSPNGTDAYVVYNAFTTPFRDDTTLAALARRRRQARRRHGGRASAPGARSIAARRAIREARARTTSRPNSSATTSTRSRRGRTERPCGTTRATRPIARRSTPGGCRCAAEDTSDDVPRPAPQQDCPATFGNTDIFGWSRLGSDAVAGARPEEAGGAAARPPLFRRSITPRIRSA